ncbi:MAG TPA: hypothetical protein VH969_14985 [Actinophytocola sp.]|uniref:hypothetical protein n=1 Tax=Actinophytocola sp. TaxID=1872138 RepID=UPI002F948507
MSTIGIGVKAGLVAAVLSGAPSTVHALVTGQDPLAATRAAGAMLLPREQRAIPLLAAAVPVHLALSLGWGVVLAAVLPRRHTTAWGAAAGLAIAALDLRVPGRRTARIRELRMKPQVADHVTFGITAGAAIAELRRQALRIR